jgi:phage FluMu protein gp41
MNIELLKDAKFDSIQDNVFEERMRVIRELSFKDKLDLALEEELISETDLEEMIYNSSISYTRIVNG